MRHKLNNTELTSLIQDIHEHDINIHTREIYLNRCTEDDDDGLDNRVAARFIKNLHLLERQNNNKIVIHMNLGGGSWEHGLAMYDAIRAVKSTITLISYSSAVSMSGVILQAADRRLMMPNSTFMMHYGSLGVDYLSSHAALELAKWNEKGCKTMLDIFTDRAINGEYFISNKMGIRKVREFIDSNMKKKGDWYLNAHESVYYGLADGVVGVNGCRI